MVVPDGHEPCPFCGFQADTEYGMLWHMEKFHAEGSSPFVVNEDHASVSVAGTSGDEDVRYAECPIDGCGETVTLAELDDHVELHDAEADQPETTIPHGSVFAYEQINGYNAIHDDSNILGEEGAAPQDYRAFINKYHNPVDASNAMTGTTQRWKQILHMPGPPKVPPAGSAPSHGAGPRKKRLGKAELGRFAHEEKMPTWLVKLLKTEGQHIQGGMIPVLDQLLHQSSTTHYAYLCDPAVEHISKLRREGGFCGYRNIQMLCSYIIGARAAGAEYFNGKLPSIFQIQDIIEDAWDAGINAQGRVETGGVKGTRKYIGTPEAQAVFTRLGIPCDAQGFKDSRPGAAESQLFAHVQTYFESGDFDPRAKVRQTMVPPIYFQHRGHSMTIVGLEKRTDGTHNLLVFDPMFHDASSITQYCTRKFRHHSPDNALKLYRRGSKYLKRFHEFEVLKLTLQAQARADDDIAAIVADREEI